MTWRARAPAAGLAAALVAGAAAAQAPAPAAAAPEVRLAIVRTATLPVREGLLFSGGRFGTELQTHFSAFLIERGAERVLVDTGLAADIARQHGSDMPAWGRPLFRAPAPVDPVRRQLDAAGVAPPQRIVLTHAHWDHASALADFPGAGILLAAPELEFVRAARPGLGTAWPTQVGLASLRWQPLDFAGGPHEGFERSEDLFGDGRVVVVPMYGHTPGSVGVFVTVASGRRFFLVGDVVWSAAALPEARPKFWPARRIVDMDIERTQLAIERIRAAQRRDPALVVVPAHDATVQDALGYFPAWLR